MLFRRTALMLLACLLAAPELYAQKASKGPHIGYVFPAGGRRGESFQVLVGGENIKELESTHISGGGITVKFVKWYRAMTQGEYVRINMKIREKTDELEKAGKKPTREQVIKILAIPEETLKEMEIYEKRRADPKRQLNPQISEEVTLQISIAADAKLGDRELRMITEDGMSNPLWFFVGQWYECRETEPNDVQPDTAIRDKMPIVVNGQIMPGDVDRFTFDARKGMKLVIQAAARELIPYLADAVPGWFQAVLTLYDERGTELAYADSFGFRQDPVMYFEVPKDGKYVIEIHDSIFRGREDFGYRLTVGEVPHITGIFPLGGKMGTKMNVELTGWNLPVESVHLEPSYDRGRAVRQIFVNQDTGVTNRVPFVVDIHNEVTEREPNNTPEEAQSVSLPVIINGRIGQPDDVDYFRFDGSGVVVAEVLARRLGSPIDSVLRLYDAHGKEEMVADDYEDKAWPLITHHADSRMVTKGTGGTHYLKIADSQRKGGPDFTYRLYIRPPFPDYDLRVVPSSVIAPCGGTVPITVHAIRKDNFDDAIALELEGAPPGFHLSGAWVPAGQSKVRLTLTVPSSPTSDPLALQLLGKASLRGRQIARPALPAEAMTQAFAYQHLIPTKDWTVAVSGKTPVKLPCAIVDKSLRLVPGGNNQLRILVDRSGSYGELKFELSEPPDGVTLGDPTAVGPGLLLPVKCDAQKVKPPLAGNLLLQVFRETTWQPKDKDKKPVTSRNLVGMLPALPFDVAGGAPGHR